MRKIIYGVLASAIAGLLTIASAGVVHAQYEDNPIWSGLWGGVNLDFSSLDTDADSSTGGSQSSTEQPSTFSQTTKYVALGDSVAAGLGVGDSSGQCGRSSSAYPNLVASSRQLELVHAACSGATVGDLFTRQGVDGPNITAQLDTAFANGRPDLITITAGANDVHWNDYFLWKCYNSTCGTKFDASVSDTYLAALRTKLHYALNDIGWRSDDQELRVILTGYYIPLSSRCAQLQDQVTAKEFRWLNGRLAALNSTIQDVARQYDFTTYVPVDFSGHDICSSDPWVQGLNDPAPFHPNAAGQREIARSILNGF